MGYRGVYWHRTGHEQTAFRLNFDSSGNTVSAFTGVDAKIIRCVRVD